MVNFWLNKCLDQYGLCDNDERKCRLLGIDHFAKSLTKDYYVDHVAMCVFGKCEISYTTKGCFPQVKRHIYVDVYDSEKNTYSYKKIQWEMSSMFKSSSENQKN